MKNNLIQNAVAKFKKKCWNERRITLKGRRTTYKSPL